MIVNSMTCRLTHLLCFRRKWSTWDEGTNVLDNKTLLGIFPSISKTQLRLQNDCIASGERSRLVPVRLAEVGRNWFRTSHTPAITTNGALTITGSDGWKPLDLHEWPSRGVYSSLKEWLENNESFPLLPQCSQINKRVPFGSQATKGATQAEGKRSPKQIGMRFCPQLFWVVILPGSLGKDTGDPSQKSVMWHFRTIKYNYDCVNYIASCV